MRVATAALCVAGLCAVSASGTVRTYAADEFELRPGTQIVQWQGRAVDVVLPDDFDQAKSYSLVVQIDGVLGDLASLEKDRTILCRPHRDTDSKWSGGAVGEICDLVAHLRKRLPIPEERVHAIGFDQDHFGIVTMLAFGKKSPFVSATYVHSVVASGSVADRAKSKMGALAVGERRDDPHAKGIVEILDGKVRSVESRDDPNGIATEYFRWWLRVMEGEFVPGNDLSFAWTPETAEPAGAEKALAAARAAAQPVFLYFYAAGDAEDADAKELQNVTFLQTSVRSATAGLVAIKLDRAAHEERFASYGLKATPAVVVLDHAGAVAAKFENKIKAAALVKAFTAAARAAAKAR